MKVDLLLSVLAVLCWRVSSWNGLQGRRSILSSSFQHVNVFSDDGEVSPYDVDLSVNASDLECAKYHSYCHSATNRSSMTCSCTEDCASYGNCCWDAAVESNLEPVYSCVYVIESGWYSVVSRCPRDWTIEDVREKCDSPYNTNSEDVLSWLPVTNIETNVTYRNVFCAACHLDRSVTSWKIGISCEGNSTNEADLQGALKSSNCRRQAIMPMAAFHIEPCFGEVDDCGAHWFHHGRGAENKILALEMRQKCWTFEAPVHVPSRGLKYKNKFCALCSGVKTKEMLCTTLRDQQYNTRVFSQTPVKVAPFSVIMDIDFSGGNRVGTKCSAGRAYDPVKKKCRSIWCGDYLDYVDGVCVGNATGDERRFDNSKPVPFNCTPRDSTLVRLASDNSSLDNGTVYCPEEEDDEENKFNETQSLLTLVCVGLSLTCLLVKMALHLMTREEWTKTAPRAIFCLSGTLFMAQLLFLAGGARTEWAAGCVVLAMFTHFCFLSSFHWTNVLAFDIWRTFSVMAGPNASNPGSKAQKRFLRYAVYSWGTPLLIVIIAALFEWVIPVDDWRPMYGQDMCWFGSRRGLVVFFAGPLACMLLLNCLFFVGTALHICRAVRASRFARENTKKECIRFGLYIKLALIMGLAWTFGFVAPFSDSEVMWIVFTVLNGVQGTFILFAFTQFGRLCRGAKSALHFGKGLSNSRRSGTSSQNLKSSSSNLTSTSNLTRSTLVLNSSLNVTSHV